MFNSFRRLQDRLPSLPINSLWHMPLYRKTVTNKRRTLHIKSKRTKPSIAQLKTVLAIHLSDFTYITLTAVNRN